MIPIVFFATIVANGICTMFCLSEYFEAIVSIQNQCTRSPFKDYVLLSGGSSSSRVDVIFSSP
jgi:hypothetical protein